ncbi:MRG-domain-containing protein [Hyaloraphidium curvatum]|nr:MRG-domain-containing protein [Hyaloraphidium curvatum]
MPGQLTFAPNENILCFHGALIYEAKARLTPWGAPRRVLKAEYWEGATPEESGPHYFVHYKGWKATWDEWVPEERALKLNDENLKRQKELVSLAKTQGQPKKKGAAAPGGKDEKGPGGDAAAQGKGAGSNKRKRETTVEKEEEFLKKAEVKLAFPDVLKVQLVDDWEWITKQQKLVKVPREPNVDRILELYKESRAGKKAPVKDVPRSDEVLEEVVNGIKVYFEKAVGNILLYRFERPQYQDLVRLETATSMTQVYGAEHLLRLFVQFPSLIAHTNMDSDAVNLLREYFTDFLKFLAKNKKEFFLSEYGGSVELSFARAATDGRFPDNASPAYVASARA